MYVCACACFVYTQPMAMRFGGYLSAAITTINHKEKRGEEKCLLHKVKKVFFVGKTRWTVLKYNIIIS